MHNNRMSPECSSSIVLHLHWKRSIPEQQTRHCWKWDTHLNWLGLKHDCAWLFFCRVTDMSLQTLAKTTLRTLTWTETSLIWHPLFTTGADRRATAPTTSPSQTITGLVRYRVTPDLYTSCHYIIFYSLPDETTVYVILSPVCHAGGTGDLRHHEMDPLHPICALRQLPWWRLSGVLPIWSVQTPARATLLLPDARW